MIKEEALENFKYRISYLIENKEVGYVILEETIDVINIVDVLVAEKYRNQKIASKLFDYIINKYKNKKEKIMLEVRVSNNPAINLYKKFNFEIIHIRKNYYKTEDAYIMEVKL